MSPVSNLLLRVLQELEYPVVADEYMLNQLGMVLEVLPEYAERAASKLRACGEWPPYSQICRYGAHIMRSCVGAVY